MVRASSAEFCLGATHLVVQLQAVACDFNKWQAQTANKLQEVKLASDCYLKLKEPG